MAIDNSYLIGLFSGASSPGANLFAALYPQTGGSGAIASPASGGGSLGSPLVSAGLSAAAQTVPQPPWLLSRTPSSAALASQVLAGHPFINEAAVAVSNPASSPDYQKLFAVYQGLSAMSGLVTSAGASTTTPLQAQSYQRAFAAGLKQISSYVDGLKLDNLTLANGQTGPSASSASGVRVDAGQYVGQALYSGDLSQEAPAFQGAVAFSADVTRLDGSTTTVSFNLGDMASTPRTLPNVIAYLNGQLAAAGAVSRFGKQLLPAASTTQTVNGATITLPQQVNSYALTLNTGSVEKVTLRAPESADAIYVAQAATDVEKSVSRTPAAATRTTVKDNVTTVTTGSNVTTTTVSQQLLKFQTNVTEGDGPPPAAQSRPGDALGVAGRSWSAALDKAVSNASAVATGSDGSVYVLTSADDTVSGQPIAGSSDVALMKYDAAGSLIYTRTLGASGSAKGLGLAVSQDGKVAVTGSVTGGLSPGDGGGLDASKSDSFVTLYDAHGDELWTQRRAAMASDQGNAVAFDASGNIYVAGTASSPMPGAAAAQGGADGYLMAFDATGKALSTQQFGTSGSDSAVSLAVDGVNVYVASVDNGDAVVRKFDVTNPAAPALAASLDLGQIQGALAGVTVSGVRVIVAGSSSNPALGGGAAINSPPGSTSVFVASLDPSLTSGSANTLAWYGGSGSVVAAGLAAANGKIYVAGRTTGDLPGTTPIGKQDGFLAQIDPATGASAWTERFSGPGGSVAPVAIAATSGGASVLDRLGLPTGAVQTGDPSDLLVAGTSLRPGDGFYVSVDGQPKTLVSVAADDTLSSLARKIERATGFRAQVSLASGGSGVEKLLIKPATTSSAITLSQGQVGSDALGALGMQPGVVQATPDPTNRSARPLSGLDLTNALNLSSPAAVAQAQTVINQAMSTVRVAYKNLVAKSQPQSSSPAQASGPVPQYLQNEIANYQAALARLGG